MRSIEGFERQYSESNINRLPLNNFVVEIAKAGFNLRAEYARRTYLQQRFGEKQGGSIWITGVTDEVTEHAYEYSRGDIVRCPPQYQFINDKLYSSRFCAFAQDLTNHKERGGSVVGGLRKVQEKLAQTPEGSYVIWVSPDGPLGINNLSYDYSWTHVFWKDRQEVNYVSLRSDFTLSEHARFLNLFLGENKQISSNTIGMPGIQQILETPVVAQKGTGINNLTDIVQMLSVVRANYSNVVYKDEQRGKIHTFEEMTDEIMVIEEKREVESQAIRDIVDIFEGKLAENGLTEEEILRIIGEYVLSLNYFFRKGYREYKGIQFDVKGLSEMLTDGYSWKMVKELQQVGGCAGGITKQKTGTFTNNTEEEFFEGKCPVCGKQVKVYLGEKCPGCDTVYECG